MAATDIAASAQAPAAEAGRLSGASPLAPRVRWTLGLLLPLALAVGWEAAVRFGLASGRLMPPPSRVGETLYELCLVAHTLEERMRVAFGHVGQRRVAQEEMQRVERLPHLARDALAHLSRRRARAVDACDDRAWVVLVKRQPLSDGTRRRSLFRDLGEQRRQGTVIRTRGEQRSPPCGPRCRIVVLVELEMLTHLDQAADRERPLDVATHPEYILGDTTEHHASVLASTQVSLPPPPCEEFTTSDPERSATRVSPPGMIRTSRPNNTKGRRSTCRPSRWSSTQHG